LQGITANGAILLRQLPQECRHTGIRHGRALLDLPGLARQPARYLAQRDFGRDQPLDMGIVEDSADPLEDAASGVRLVQSDRLQHLEHLHPLNGIYPLCADIVENVVLEAR
jgi:hypothetical protein